MADLQGPVAKRAQHVLDLWKSLANGASTPSTILPMPGLDGTRVAKAQLQGDAERTPPPQPEDEPSHKRLKPN